MFLFSGSQALAALPEQERILSYDSQITVSQDGSMVVMETIQAVALGGQIKHGIYRDFPTKYKDVYGGKYNVGFEIISIKKDGAPENFFTEGLSNGVRIYIGKKDVLLNPGIYTYEITYKTSRQLGFFPDHDELFWNVTGNGWVFPIDKAAATVILPAGIAAGQIKTEAYTGPRGSFDKNYQASFAGAQARFKTTKPLNSYEGLTIVVGWPKGFVLEPAAADKAKYFLRDNLGTIAGLAGLIVLLAYYLLAWLKVGKDPKKGTIIPQYEPPKGFSAAAIRFLVKMGVDSAQRNFTAQIIEMAVNGLIKI